MILVLLLFLPSTLAYTTNGNSANSCGDPSTSGSYYHCDAGEYCDTNGLYSWSYKCKNCQPGQYQDEIEQGKCKTCNTGMTSAEGSSSSSSCTTKVCTCVGGTGATGSSCPTHNTAKCVACNTGYYPNGDACEAYTCTCSGGTGATGIDCPTHNTAKCVSCTGYRYLSNGECLDWSAPCSWYSEYESTSPTNTQNRVCATKVCTCDDGTGATGIDCPTHDALECTSCKEGYHLTPWFQDSTVCFKNLCTCSGGTGAEGTDCPTWAAAKCVSCSGSRYLSNGECLDWSAPCSSSQYESTSPTNTTNRVCSPLTTCSSSQYESTSPTNTQDRVCATKVCKCSNGTGAEGTDCPTHDADMCASCNNGYFPWEFWSWSTSRGAMVRTVSCGRNDCKCSNGTGATGTDCPMHNTAKCVSCNTGYYLNGDACEAYTCTCSNGSPATGSACTSDGAKCESCNDGYTKSPNFDCSALCDIDKCKAGEYNNGTSVTLIELIKSKQGMCGKEGERDPCDMCTFDQLKDQYVLNNCD